MLEFENLSELGNRELDHGANCRLASTLNVVLITNTGWGGSASIASAAVAVGAFPWSVSSKDSAFLVTLPPGNCTAAVQRASGNTGIGLVEVYVVQRGLGLCPETLTRIPTLGILPPLNPGSPEL